MPAATTQIEQEPMPAASLASMQRLAKTTAVASFESKLVALGIPAPMAASLARAVVDPADARRRLDRLTQIRVPGGIIHALETTVWATAVVPYVVNNREASDRHFPAGVKTGVAEAARYKPLRPPVDAADGSARLEITAQERQHLIWSLERSARFLLENNDLTESIGSQGVMQHITIAVVDVTFENGDKPVTMLASADGSSRANGCHVNLGLTPHDVLYRFPRNERAHRQYISELLKNLERPADAVPAEDVARLRALEIPARVFVQFEPDPVTPVTFAKAVESFVHLVHVEPPKPWDEAASLDAKADSVLGELLAQGQITPRRKAYLEGMLSPEEAQSSKLPSFLDERALEIVALISSEKAGVYKAVREGVLLLSKRGGQVRKEAKAEIAVELALRGHRSNMTKADAKGARETLKNAYLHADIWAKGVKPSDQDLEDLRDASLNELSQGGPGRACLTIAAQGAYWLAVQRILREARFFDPDKDVRDPRAPHRVLSDLMRSRWGIQVLYRAIVDGRDQVLIAQVDEEGRRLKGVNGKILQANHAWLRGEVVSQQPTGPGAGGDGGPGNGADDGGPALPDRILLMKLAAVRSAVDQLEDAHADLKDVTDASGNVLVDHDGIAEDTVEDIRRRLEDLRGQFFLYSATWKRKNSERMLDDTGEADDSEGKVS
jgi:hypothetical protein